MRDSSGQRHGEDRVAASVDIQIWRSCSDVKGMLRSALDPCNKAGRQRKFKRTALSFGHIESSLS